MNRERFVAILWYNRENKNSSGTNFGKADLQKGVDCYEKDGSIILFVTVCVAGAQGAAAKMAEKDGYVGRLKAQMMQIISKSAAHYRAPEAAARPRAKAI